MIVRRVARPMLASIFIAGGIEALRNTGGKVEAATPLIKKAEGALPNDVTEKVPTDPETLVRINAIVQVGGGVLLATGKAPRFASAALAGSLIPTTLAGHAFWEETDPVAKAAQRTQFFKNLSLLGGLLIAAVDTEGKPSLAWRGRKAVSHASDVVVTALPGSSSSDTSDHVIEGLHVAGDKVKGLAAVAADRGSDLAVVAQDRGSKWAEIAQERGGKWAERAAERAADLAEVAQERGGELAKVAQKRGGELAEVAGQRGAVLAERARSDGEDLASSLADWSDKYGKKAKKQAAASGKDAKKQWKSARKDAKKQWKASRKTAEKQLDAARKAAETKASATLSQLDDKVGGRLS